VSRAHRLSIKTMNRRFEPAFIDVEHCYVEGASTAREALRVSREMNLSPEMHTIRETFRSRELTAFCWSGDECRLIFDRLAIRLKANLGRICLSGADSTILIDPFADSPDRWILRFRYENTFEVDWLSRLAVWRFPQRLSDPSFDSLVRDSLSPFSRYENPTRS